MTTKEKIAVMQAFDRGEKIQVKLSDESCEKWTDVENPMWNWVGCLYRVKKASLPLGPGDIVLGNTLFRRHENERMLAVGKNLNSVDIGGFGGVTFETLALKDSCWRYSSDSGITWHPCHK